MSATRSPADDGTDAENQSNTDRLRTYLAEQASKEGELYVKGKFIADEVGLSPKQIGQLMIRLQDSASELEIEKWSYTGATTWRVAPQSA